MPIMWSRIHAELGLSPSPLSWAMVEQAVAVGMGESEDLDWKQGMPPASAEKKWWEFAKDVAAMANTRGGLIVYGVAERQERAAELVGVATGPQDRQALHAWAVRWVRPLVDGLRIEPLENPEGGSGLIAVFVPPSSEAPHVVGEKNEIGVPYRYGSHTNWMTEGELERAYRDRFARRGDDRAALAALIDGLALDLDLTTGVWVAVAARPALTPPQPNVRPDPERAAAAMREALRVAEEMFPERYGRAPILTHLRDHGDRPRLGLRRWTIRAYHFPADEQGPVMWAVVELHHDGSMAMAIAVDGFQRGAQIHAMPDGAWPVSVRHVDSLITEAVALAAVHVRGLGGVGPVLVRAALLRDDTTRDRPMAAITNLSSWHRDTYHWPAESRLVHRPIAVEAAFAADDDIDALRATARQLADDIDTQFEISGSSVP
ncbi:AlbA family DNA-binding domain-containing protein [Actinokineospora sp. NPDC004072]